MNPKELYRCREEIEKCKRKVSNLTSKKDILSVEFKREMLILQSKMESMVTHYNHKNDILTKEIERENGNLLELQEKLNNQ